MPYRAAAVCVLIVLGFLFALPLRAAELEGVRMPDKIVAAGTNLILNGIGLRTFSLFKVPVYVAGLYLQQPSHDAEAILDSRAVKVIDVHFVHDASAERVRDAWREGFETDCQSPCALPPDQVAKFLATVPALNAGDTSMLVYAPDYVTIAVNGVVLGKVTHPQFMRVLLATFIGPHPPTARLKRELLGLPKED